MSLYNALFGVQQSVFFILPMLGKHPDEYPRFRDCFVGDSEHPEHDGKIIVYTRTGGGNRESYAEENEAIRQMDGFIEDYDDSFDYTFANWVFDVPERWRKDFDAIMNGKWGSISEEYINEMIRVYPKLESKLRETFAKDAEIVEEKEGV